PRGSPVLTPRPAPQLTLPLQDVTDKSGPMAMTSLTVRGTRLPQQGDPSFPVRRMRDQGSRTDCRRPRRDDVEGPELLACRSKQSVFRQVQESSLPTIDVH